MFVIELGVVSCRPSPLEPTSVDQYLDHFYPENVRRLI
jgi:hypothetical protein